MSVAEYAKVRPYSRNGLFYEDSDEDDLFDCCNCLQARYALSVVAANLANSGRNMYQGRHMFVFFIASHIVSDS